MVAQTSVCFLILGPILIVRACVCVCAVVECGKWIAEVPRQDATAQQQQQANGWTNPFRVKSNPLATVRAPAVSKTERRKK